MQDRRQRSAEPLLISEAALGLQVAMRQLQGKFWKEFGSRVVVYGPASEIWFDETALSRLEIHQGNPEVIGEIVAEARRSKVPQHKPKRTRSGKPGFGRKTFP